MRDPLGKKNLRDDGERAKEDLQTNAKDMGKYYPNVYEVAQEWTREDIDAMLEEKLEGFKSARERVLLSAVAGKIEL